MKLGIDASNLKEGGGIRHLTEILDNVEPQTFGFSEIILWIGEEQGKPFLSKYSWLTVILVRAFDKGLINRFLWRKFKLKKVAVDECNLLFSPGGLILGAKIPEVTMCRNMQPFDSFARKAAGLGKSRLRLEALKIVHSLSFKKAKTVIFLNEYVKGLLSGKLGLKNTMVIPHGCGDVFSLKPRPQVEFNSESRFEILYVSSINSYKHHSELISAFAKVEKLYPNSTLTLIGSGSNGQMLELENQIDFLNIKNITLLGKVEPQYLHEHYHLADLFVYPSSCENLPNILLEAMKSGLPIVSSEIQPMPTVLKDGGVYCSPFDSSSIEKSLLKVIRNKELRTEISMKAYKESEHYNWKKCATLTFTLLSQVAKNVNN